MGSQIPIILENISLRLKPMYTAKLTSKLQLNSRVKVNHQLTFTLSSASTDAYSVCALDPSVSFHQVETPHAVKNFHLSRLKK